MYVFPARQNRVPLAADSDGAAGNHTAEQGARYRERFTRQFPDFLPDVQLNEAQGAKRGSAGKGILCLRRRVCKRCTLIIEALRKHAGKTGRNK